MGYGLGTRTQAGGVTVPEVPVGFVELIATITGRVAGQPLTPALAETLAAEFPPEGAVFTGLRDLCVQGCAEGWLCAREAGGIRFGRPVKPSEATHGFSVDVVEMDEIVGPRHAHPNGEIDMVMPLEGPAEFYGTPCGWKVYEASSAHYPTATGGKALVLYLLPGGAIEFTRD
jgi:hypothetical protein